MMSFLCCTKIRLRAEPTPQKKEENGARENQIKSTFVIITRRGVFPEGENRATGFVRTKPRGMELGFCSRKGLRLGVLMAEYLPTGYRLQPGLKHSNLHDVMSTYPYCFPPRTSLRQRVLRCGGNMEICYQMSETQPHLEISSKPNHFYINYCSTYILCTFFQGATGSIWN